MEQGIIILLPNFILFDKVNLIKIKTKKIYWYSLLVSLIDIIDIREKMLKKMNVWAADIKWGSMKIDLHPNWKIMIPWWTIPALLGEIICRYSGGGKFIGLFSGLFISSLKTMFDYAVLMYDYRTVRDVKRRRF
ncbi:MAG: hypothetical protein DRN17_07895 [Thermoplasmata archaeon]|nr:MAG: hypothetical protein DRN17_07895 [Thermoplasmata archaeon]